MPQALNLIGEKYGKLTVIRKAPNVKGRTAWYCLCDCGNSEEIIVTTKNLRNGITQSCGCLKRKDIAGQKFGKLTAIRPTKERRHNSVVWECHCDCGNPNPVYATVEGLRVGDNTSCGCFNKARIKFKEEYSVDFTGKTFGLLKVLGPTDMRASNGNQMWKCECQCSNKTICYVSTNHLQTGNTKSCGCLQSHSYGELKIAEILDEHNILYKKEYSFIDLPNRRYDFAIFNTNNKIVYLIEFDGEQHYIETPFFKTTLKEQQKIDQEKTKFAEEKGITLIRIPYWERDNLSFELLGVNINELSQ